MNFVYINYIYIYILSTSILHIKTPENLGYLSEAVRKRQNKSTRSAPPKGALRVQFVCWKLLRLLADVSQNAAVNVQDEAVDEVGSGRGEEDGGAAQILSFAPAA